METDQTVCNNDNNNNYYYTVFHVGKTVYSILGTTSTNLEIT